MKKVFLILFFPVGLAFGQSKTPAVKPMNANDSLSYALGVQIATFYKNQGLDSLNSSALKKAFDDVYAGKNTMSADEAGQFMQKAMQQVMSERANKAREESKRFLAENAKREGVISLPSGLQYEIITKGDGPVPTAQSRIKAHYAGTLINGVEFDNSYKRGEPLELNVGGVIQGWQEALQLMPVGSKWKLYIPSELGYGDRGAGEIPGGAALIFTIELLEILQ